MSPSDLPGARLAGFRAWSGVLRVWTCVRWRGCASRGLVMLRRHFVECVRSRLVLFIVARQPITVPHCHSSFAEFHCHCHCRLPLPLVLLLLLPPSPAPRVFRAGPPMTFPPFSAGSSWRDANRDFHILVQSEQVVVRRRRPTTACILHSIHHRNRPGTKPSTGLA
jgi:hypothetical protein